jgi:Fic family protein
MLWTSMEEARVFEQLWIRLEADRANVQEQRRRRSAPWRRLELEEILGSTALAGSALDFEEVAALVELGQVAGGRRLSDCILVADYADAARYVREAPAPGRRQPFLRLDEVVALHAHALRRTPEARPGVWRTTTIAAFPSGVVPPPAWMIARTMAAFTDRFAGGPPVETNPLLWVVDAHARFMRIQPFAAGNGRVARLLTNLLLLRLGLPPLVIGARDRARYLRDRIPSGGRGVPPLAVLFARSLLATTSALVGSMQPDDELRPVAAFAVGAERAALYKAAQRDRLQTVRRDSALLTTATWIADYRASRRER